MESMQRRDAGLVTFLVTGDVVVDHHLYVGERNKAAGSGFRARAAASLVEFGGAALIERLLDTRSDAEPRPWSVAFGLVKDGRLYEHTFAVWEPREPPGGDKKSPKVWLAQEAGYGPPPASVGADDIAATATAARTARVGDPDSAASTGPAAESCPARSRAAPDSPEILVVDDAGAGFRDRPACWPECLATDGKAPRWFIWKMSGDPRGGPFWEHVRANEAVHDRTILVVTAADLRRAGFDVSRGLSWERTARDAGAGLPATRIEPLVRCRHLVVTFRGAGALWLDRTDRAKPVATLVYDPGAGEDDLPDGHGGKAFGYQASLTAGVAWSVASAADAEQPDIVDGVRRGLAACRLLYSTGHGAVDGGVPPVGFPAERLRRTALAPAPDPRTAPPRVEVPDPQQHPDWTILAQETIPPGPLFDSAWTIAMHGLSKLRSVPMLQVGNFTTIDRSEIESIRRIRRCVLAYERETPQERPLSIAVFGAPGAGKSFIVKQIARGCLGKDVEIVECNLSQISDERELIGAFHLVRDKVLAGRTPVVFWDEFDSEGYRWLRLLLAPMEDGKFREGQIVHPIGKCVFVFAGGTSATFEEFGRPVAGEDPAQHAREWRLRKGPDFKSRIDDHLDVLGPNQRTLPRTSATEDPPADRADVCFPIRRALFVRAVWGLGADRHSAVEPGLLEAILAVPRYTHGSRSLQRLLAHLARAGTGIGHTELPERAQLEVLVEGLRDAKPASEWMAWFARRSAEERAVGGKLRAAIDSRVDEIAARIHDKYVQTSEGSRRPDVSEAFEDLPLFLKESNRAAARRVWGVLTAAGIRIVPADAPDALSREEGRALLERSVDQAAEEEHAGWCVFHTWRGWVPTERQDQRKEPESNPPRHNALVKWEVLIEKYRELDREQVRLYVDIVYDLGFAVAATFPFGERPIHTGRTLGSVDHDRPEA